MKTDRKKRFQTRFERYYPMLCRIAAGYLADSDDCEDVVQELFISIWNHGKDDLEEDAFVAYLKTATRNNCITFLRRHRRLDTVSAHTEASLQLSDTTESEQPTDYATLLDTLLALLPPKCRDVFMMSKIQKMKYKEIAAALDISEKTVENHIGKAIHIIRAYATSHPTLLWLATCSQLINLGLWNIQI